MNNTLKGLVREVYQMLGAELRSVRLAKGLSIVEAAELVGFEGTRLLEYIESGQANHVFAALRVISFYGKKVEIRLVDRY